jgi:hypothetical protein
MELDARAPRWRVRRAAQLKRRLSEVVCEVMNEGMLVVRLVSAAWHNT